jgi:hypothetical protein
MTDYLEELNELKVLFNDLDNYSRVNSYVLQILLERYDGVVEQLYSLNSKVFRSSFETIIEAENDLSYMINDKIPSFKRKMLFEKNKFKLKAAVNNDVSRYEHYKLIEQIVYN